MLASSDKSRHVSARGDGAVVVSEALLRLCAAGGLSWPAYLGAAHLLVGALRAVRSAVEQVLIAVVIVKVGAAWRSACEMAARVF